MTEIRFIPAIAGNTCRQGVAEERAAVHPRDRGEHSTRGIHRYPHRGSSPRSRGTRNCVPRAPSRPRFIPAIAGNTTYCGAAPSTLAVHPRDRGEHPIWDAMYARVHGSSPRSRGTRGLRADAHPGGWFIPAIAGNTRPCRIPASKRSVHPRDRGEHRSRSVLARLNAGSSPRSRGTP